MSSSKSSALHPYCRLLPVAGSIVYLALYAVAVALYPGGSPVDRTSPGFSWLHNYWCNLLNESALNGQPNPARPVALLAMSILCLSLTFFWYLLPGLFKLSSLHANAIRVSGILAMVFASFIFTGYHDLVITIAGLFGLVALTGTFVGLYKTQLHKLLGFGVLCLLLMVVNNYVYYTGHFLYFLPVIQKLTLLVVLTWLSLLTIQVYRVGKEHKLHS